MEKTHFSNFFKNVFFVSKKFLIPNQNLSWNLIKSGGRLLHSFKLLLTIVRDATGIITAKYPKFEEDWKNVFLDSYCKKHDFYFKFDQFVSGKLNNFQNAFGRMFFLFYARNHSIFFFALFIIHPDVIPIGVSI